MRLIALIVRAGAVVVASAFVFSLLVDGQSNPATAGPDLASVTKPEPKPPAKARTTAKRTAPKVPEGVVAIVATGDIVMGSTPNLPPDGGRSFFSDVQTDLAGDVVLGNLEGTLSTGGASKCGKGSTNCFAFQTPPSYARWLRQAGFTVMNLANNHAFDFGAGGLEQTRAALDRVGLISTGRPGQITVQRVGDIRVAASNVHAGAKYMDQLISKYLADAQFDETDRTLFAFAAYNCGPGNIRRMRAEAEKRGLDKNRWFNHVELVTAEKIGAETTTYVRNIYKYYVAYKLMTDIDEVQRKAREGVQAGGK